MSNHPFGSSEANPGTSADSPPLTTVPATPHNANRDHNVTRIPEAVRTETRTVPRNLPATTVAAPSKVSDRLRAILTPDPSLAAIRDILANHFASKGE